jgi:8-oxo-dGTP pyrophosphatase MutT (NUDIX family)
MSLNSKNKKLYRKSVFVVVYKLEKNKPTYLLLKRKLHWRGWEFPKGGIDKGESALQAVKREVKEETGQKIIKIKRYNIRGKYPYPKFLDDRPNNYGQSYELFSVESLGEKVSLDKHEHSGFLWLPLKKAIKKLTWPDQKKCLKIVDKSLDN